MVSVDGFTLAQAFPEYLDMTLEEVQGVIDEVYEFMGLDVIEDVAPPAEIEVLAAITMYKENLVSLSSSSVTTDCYEDGFNSYCITTYCNDGACAASVTNW